MRDHSYDDKVDKGNNNSDGYNNSGINNNSNDNNNNISDKEIK